MDLIVCSSLLLGLFSQVIGYFCNFSYFFWLTYFDALVSGVRDQPLPPGYCLLRIHKSCHIFSQAKTPETRSQGHVKEIAWRFFPTLRRRPGKRNKTDASKMLLNHLNFFCSTPSCGKMICSYKYVNKIA
jgi:hypothetical protein